MAVTDANYQFVYVDIGSYGKCGDSTIFQQSTLYQRINTGTMDIPEDRPISQTRTTPIPFVFLADDAFSQSQRIMCPFIGKQLNMKKRLFNYRHCRGRRYVECTFGILANKWRIFHRALNVNIELAIDIIKACCVLHNYVRSRDGFQFADTLYRFPSDDNIRGGTHTRQYNSNARNILAEYFANEGAVSWQNHYL
ncbi:hypothetical protein J6590_108180 [Homalodisca vitripennis]|nr:hypothetical protein J6590_108427 [Homalodisca vitripennis]KAG8274625.1 hypothetical protein J6590_108180 [Homalodisca vitripennis]